MLKVDTWIISPFPLYFHIFLNWLFIATSLILINQDSNIYQIIIFPMELFYRIHFVKFWNWFFSFNASYIAKQFLAILFDVISFYVFIHCRYFSSIRILFYSHNTHYR